MASDIEFEEFDDLSSNVERAGHKFFRTALVRWFAFVDKTAPFSEIVHRAESAVDLENWLNMSRKSVGSFVGSGELDWPQDGDDYLGMQCALFRAFKDKELEPTDFALNFMYRENNFDTMVGDIVDQIFIPLCRDIRRRATKVSDHEGEYPAADRTVNLDHNQSSYSETVQAIDSTITALEQSNSLPDTEDREQRLAELSAGLRLLQATKVRTSALVAVLVVPLTYLATKFFDSLIGKAAEAALKALEVLIGMSL